jgi:gas vesicle protein
MSTENDQPTVIIEKDGRPEIAAFLLGALVGAGIALLFAPSSGQETQRRIREQASRLRALTEDRVRNLREDLGSRLDSARKAADQGRLAAADARADLEDKLARSKAAYRAGLDAAREEYGRQQDNTVDEESGEDEA